MDGRPFSVRAMLALSAAVGAFGTAGAAHAQQPADQPTADIIVTAQKRSENLQDVPISISVVSAKQLTSSGASQITDFGPYVAGLQVDSAGTPGQATISLRGVAPIGPSATVGTYLDDAPVGSSTLFARAAGFSLDLLPYDIQRVEILRGPQGTLYGASSIGGLIKYVTVAPSLTDLSVKAGGEVFGIRHGGHAGYAGQAMINAPIVTDTLGIVASYAYRKAPGYVDSAVTGKRDQNDYVQQGGRGGLLWQASDAFKLRLTALWQKVDADGTANVAEDIETGQRLGDGMSNNNYVDEPFRKSIQYYAATLDYDLGFADLTSVTTYSRTKTSVTNDATAIFGAALPFPALTPLTVTLGLKRWTQEVRLASPTGGRFEWLLGGFYTSEKSGNGQLLNALLPDGTSIPGLDPLATASIPSRYREYALFGNATYKFSDRFDITGGLCWAHNRQKFRQLIGGAIVPPADMSGKSSESVLTYSVSPRFHVNDDVMIYARVASGFRPGGPNAPLANLIVAAVKSDRLTNYEIGVKAALLDRRLLLDVAAFYMDWKDIQMTVDLNGFTGLANAGKARSQGIEASLTWQPFDGLRLGVNGAYTDAKLTDDTPASVGGKDGDRLPRIPKWSGSLTADYSFAVDDQATMQLGAGLRHTGRRISELESRPTAIYAKAYTALDLNAALTIDERWTLKLYARNVTDSHGEITRDIRVNALGQPSFIQLTPVQPRTIGLGVDISF